MGIPEYVRTKLQVKNISFSEPNVLTVEFSSTLNVKVIFKYARNLKEGQRISIHVPKSLAARYDDLRNQAFFLRNESTTKHKTLIKYTGYELFLYARSHLDEDWKRMPDC